MLITVLLISFSKSLGALWWGWVPKPARGPSGGLNQEHSSSNASTTRLLCLKDLEWLFFLPKEGACPVLFFFNSYLIDWFSWSIFSFLCSLLYKGDKFELMLPFLIFINFKLFWIKSQLPSTEFLKMFYLHSIDIINNRMKKLYLGWDFLMLLKDGFGT